MTKNSGLATFVCFDEVCYLWVDLCSKLSFETFATKKTVRYNQVFVISKKSYRAVWGYPIYDPFL